MVYETETPKRGIMISIRAYRKSRGMKGCGRGASTGKKAIITQEGKDPVILRGSSSTDLCRQIREQFDVPAGVKINSPGVTYL